MQKDKVIHTHTYNDKNAVSQMRFPQKLWYLLKLRTDTILWGGTGRTILLNYKVLEDYLQSDLSIFKTTNISSFVRQLNLYGFKKVTSHLLDPICNSSNPYMHEYVHDYFQYGRPELLNKINRKAFAMKRPIKSKIFHDELLQTPFSTPLQRARYALKIALNKAAHDLYTRDSSRTARCFNFEYQENHVEHCDQEEKIKFNWIGPPNIPNEETSTPSDAEEMTTDEQVTNPENDVDCSEPAKADQTLVFDKEMTPKIPENGLPDQFLNMPELDLESNAQDDNELLSEFDLNSDTEQVIAKRLEQCTSSQDNSISLNCILPSVGHIDDVSIADRSVCYSSYYSGEWEQMFNDIISSKGPSQGFASDVKEFYSQVSKTIDLLNA